MARPVPPKTRGGRRRRLSTPKVTESDAEAETENKVGTPRAEDNPPSSPFESSPRTREGEPTHSLESMRPADCVPGKRKASLVETPDSRDIKRMREDSEFAEDDDQCRNNGTNFIRYR